MTEPPPDWDDERLGAAFAARAAGAPATPPDLALSVMDLVGGRTSRGGRFAPWLTAAAGIAVVLAMAAVFAVRPGPILPGTGSATPGGTQAGRPAPTTGPAAALGDPISVSAAIGVRDGGGVTDRELVVAGFLSPMPTLACPFIPAGQNPTRIVCPQSFQWLMEQPEILMTVGADGTEGGPPKGPAFHPSFALVEPPTVPFPPNGGVRPVPVVLIGHFHDRRATLCEPAEVAACGEAFIVDRVAAVNGAQRLPTTVRRLERFDDATQRQVTETPIDLEEDVDRLVYAVAPEAQIESRQLVTIDQVIGIEPILKDDEVVPTFTPTSLMWIVTAVDLRDGVPVARTFALIDGTSWIAEVTAAGATRVIRHIVVGPSDGAEPIAPTADPTAFDGAPAAVLGLEVRGVSEVTQGRRLAGAVDRDEYAIRGWYVAPNPDAGCTPSEPAIHPPGPPCDSGRHWLLDRPDQLGIEPGQVRADPDQWPAVLNPLLPVGVPFDVPDTWLAGAARPQPVVVLGHFSDVRVDAYRGDVYFVIDALAWTRDRSIASTDTLVRLTSAATEDPQDVLARIGRVSPNETIATWTTVVDAADFAAIEGRNALDVPEFTVGPPVWIVRRLVHDPVDGRPRVGVAWAYTADHGNRVWQAETPDSSVDLATSLDLRDADPHYPLVRVFDYARQLAGVRSAANLGSVTWQRAGSSPRGGLQVARGATDREVAVRWSAGACNADWRLQVRRALDGSVTLVPSLFSDECSGDALQIRLVLVFDHPVDIDRITTGDPCCG